MTISVINTLKVYLSRIYQYRSFKQGNKDNQPLPRPDGYEPLNVSIAGVMYEDNLRTFLSCSLKEKVSLRREPDNPHDKNAIKVVTQSGHRIGYIGRYWAAQIAPHMDTGNDPIQAMITEMDSDVSESVIGGKVGFYVPVDLFKLISSNFKQLDYYYDTSSTGTIYLMLDCDEAILKQVTDKLKETGHAWERFGIGYHPATDGRQYRWYVVLEDSVTQESIEQFFRDHFDIAPQREQGEPSIEWIETFDIVNINLREENIRLNEELRKAKEKIANMERRLSHTERKECKFADEVMAVIQILLPNITFLKNSIDVITRELNRQVLKAIYKITTDPMNREAIKVRGADGWRELRFNTGQADDGRLYFKHKENGWLVLVSFKGSQERDIRYLQNN